MSARPRLLRLRVAVSVSLAGVASLGAAAAHAQAPAAPAVPAPAAPVTAAPVTAAPVTAAPATAVPVTAAPAAAVPATAVPATAGAEPAPSLMTGVEPRPVKFDLGVATEFPVMLLGATTLLEVPFGIQIRADVGWLGTPYTNVINGVLDAAGAYGSGAEATDTQEAHPGCAPELPWSFAPAPGGGRSRSTASRIFGGYTLVALGGSLGAKDAITTLTGKQFTNDEERSDVIIHSTLHNVNVGFGWRWLFLNDHLVLRLSGEYLQTVASATSLTLQTSQGSTALPNISSSLNTYLDGIYKTYVKAPVVSLGGAYRF